MRWSPGTAVGGALSVRLSAGGETSRSIAEGDFRAMRERIMEPTIMRRSIALAPRIQFREKNLKGRDPSSGRSGE